MVVDFLKDLKIEKNKIIVLHVRLKGIPQNDTYPVFTAKLLEHLQREFSPKTILIPTFTYSFTRSGIFDTEFSPSEVGRFSEEARSFFGSQHRLIHPVFSFIDTKKYFSNFSYRYDTAFGDNSVFSYLSMEGCYILNINLEQIVNSYFHYLEEKFQVPYRKFKVFKGIIRNGDTIEAVDLRYYVRDLTEDLSWNRTRIEIFLENRNILKKDKKNNVNVSVVYSKDLDQYLGREIERDNNFLIR